MSGRSAPLAVLLVDDDLAMTRVYEEYMKGDEIAVTVAHTGREALDRLTAAPPDVLLLDLHLPDMHGFDVLRAVTDAGYDSEVVVVTGHGSMAVAIDAMRLGARDFLVKPFSKDRLLTTLRNVGERRHLARIVETYRSEIDRHACCGFIGSSLAMQGVYRIIDSAAKSKATVFITGESGTGKEVCAEAIHVRSPRAGKPFVALNCGAFPRNLIESEIFGHVKGAFTGALRDRDGAAALADGGTLFLDEIGEMDVALQPKLLRFLQTQTVQPVGGDAARKVDVRIICATNRDPWEEVAAGRLREDLFYRLYVLPIQLPPLRERDADVLEIAQHFLGQFAAEEGKSFSRFAPEVEDVLLGFDWPGNVRQLQNVIRHIVVMNPGGEVVAAMLPPPLAGLSKRRPEPPPQSAAACCVLRPDVAEDARPEDRIRPIAELEREAIETAIGLCRGNIPRAAECLGLSTATLYRKKAQWKDGPDATGDDIPAA